MILNVKVIILKPKISFKIDIFDERFVEEVEDAKIEYLYRVEIEDLISKKKSIERAITRDHTLLIVENYLDFS